MEEQTYFISEVSRLVGVEPHVLRYWEEELELKIGRNSQGKRCYTESDVAYLKEVKRWKDKGMQLRAVKEFLETGKADISSDIDADNTSEEQEKNETDAPANEDKREEKKPDGKETYELVTVEEASDSMTKFEQLMNGMIQRELEKNNETLVRELCDALSRELDERLEAKVEELVQRELMQEMLRQGERETAAASSKIKKTLRQRWKEWTERHLG